MLILYDDDLTKQTFVEQQRTVAEVTGCEIKGNQDDYFVIGEVEDPAVTMDRHALSKLPNGQLIHTLFFKGLGPLTTIYDGVKNNWFRADGTWPTTIDSLVHIRGQAKSEAFKGAKVILDLACGNGMAGIYAGNKIPDLCRVDSSDIEPNASRTFQANKRAFATREFKGSYFIRDCYEAVIRPQNGYDVIIASAIPSTPIPPQGVGRSINPLFEGTDVLERILRETPEYLAKKGKLILSHSSVGENAFKEAAKKYGANVDRVLDEREVVFRTEFLNNQRWVDYLVETGGMMVKEDSQWKYWHKPIVKEISFS